MSTQGFLRASRALVLPVVIGISGLVAGCASSSPNATTKTPRIFGIGVSMQGAAPFCVYELHVKIDGHTIYPLGGNGPGDLPICTEKSTRGGIYRGGTMGTALGYKDYKTYSISFRRGKESPVISAEFDIAGKLAPIPGQRLFTLEPVITPTGAKLIRHDLKPDISKGTDVDVFYTLGEIEGH